MKPPGGLNVLQLGHLRLAIRTGFDHCQILMNAALDNPVELVAVVLADTALVAAVAALVAVVALSAVAGVLVAEAHQLLCHSRK